MSSRFAIVLANLFALFASACAVGAQAKLTTPARLDEPVTVQLSGDQVAWGVSDPAGFLQVFVGRVDDCCEGRTPMAGAYEVKGDALRFRPSFGFLPGQDYVARLGESQRDARQRTAFRIDSESPAVDAKVVEVYPSGETLPENVLRVYIHFATPMQPHLALDHIKLLDASGNPDDAAFMRFKQELWDEDRTRLTLLMDPGRIKRSVATRLRLGPALLAGHDYELVIEGGWPAADGHSVLPSFSKRFSVSERLRHLPDTERWKISAPRLGTTEAVEVRLDRPFDRARLQQDLRIFSVDGGQIHGQIEIGKSEKEWRFVPDSAWPAREILLVVNAALEDVAGNNFQDLLDHTAGTETLEFSQLAISIPLEGRAEPSPTAPGRADQRSQ